VYLVGLLCVVLSRLSFNFFQVLLRLVVVVVVVVVVMGW
jgi:hypothetical protein